LSMLLIFPNSFYEKRCNVEYLRREALRGVWNAGPYAKLFFTYRRHEALPALIMRQELSRSAGSDPVSRKRK
jgi:hypothetical protein